MVKNGSEGCLLTMKFYKSTSGAALLAPENWEPEGKHIWELTIIHCHKIMENYPYPFLVVISQFFSLVIFINDCICILTGSPR